MSFEHLSKVFSINFYRLVEAKKIKSINFIIEGSELKFNKKFVKFSKNSEGDLKMENKKYTMNLGYLYLTDRSFKKLVDEFLVEKPTTVKIKYAEALNIFYNVLKNESDIFPKKNSTLQINKLHLGHILKIQIYIETLGKKPDKKILLIYLNDFCEFLTKNNIAKIFYKLPNKQDARPKKENNHSITVKFQHYMIKKNYALSTCKNYVMSVEMFLRLTNYRDDLLSNTEFWVTSFTKFEEKIGRRVITEAITPGTGYEYLKAVSLFSKFLYEENIISFKYKVSQRLICNGNRSNEYVKNEDILLVIEKIFESSTHVLRDISILMILIETGCRPIEVVNLNIDDIYIFEKLIVLKSIKSSQRTLKLSDTSINIIKLYLLIRRNYLPDNSTQSLFLTTSGAKMPSDSITQLIRKYNMEAFKENRFTPKTLRHRFITDALNAGNNPDQVRESAGHKHPISTHYYFYRDLNKLKNLFIGKSLIWGDQND